MLGYIKAIDYYRHQISILHYHIVWKQTYHMLREAKVAKLVSTAKMTNCL